MRSSCDRAGECAKPSSLDFGGEVLDSGAEVAVMEGDAAATAVAIEGAELEFGAVIALIALSSLL